MSQHKQSTAGASRIDQVADIDVSARDHAGERSNHAFEAFELAQPLDIGVGGRHVRAGLRVAAAALVEFLLRHRVFLAQGFPALHAARRQRQARCRLLARGDRLRQLLVDLRSFELGQQFAFFDAAADILVPAFHVTAGARGDRRLHEALQRARQSQCLAGFAHFREYGLYILLGAFRSARFQQLLIGEAAQHRAARSHCQQDDYHYHQNLGAAHDLSPLQRFAPIVRMTGAGRMAARRGMMLFRHCFRFPGANR